MTTQLKWDLGFFVKNVPKQWNVCSENIRGAIPNDWALKGWKELVAKLPLLAVFEADAVEGFRIYIIRVQASDPSEAFEKGWHLLGQIVDWWSLGCNDLPIIAPFALFRRDNDADAEIRRFAHQTWVFATSNNPKLRSEWEARVQMAMERTFVLVKRGLNAGWDALSPLERQISHSLRLYRKGCGVECYGVEYLCKFAALDGLVASDTRRDKGNMIQDRLTALFRGAKWNVDGCAKTLWDTRHLVAHEGNAGLIPHDRNSVHYETLIPQLDCLATGAFVFASDNLSKATTVEQLWALARSYDLPPTLLDERPVGMDKWGGWNVLTKTGIVWKRAGDCFDRAFAAPV